MCIWNEDQSLCLEEGATTQRRVTEVEIMMITVEPMNDEGHRHNTNDETDDNDDVLSIFT